MSVHEIINLTANACYASLEEAIAAALIATFGRETAQFVASQGPEALKECLKERIKLDLPTATYEVYAMAVWCWRALDYADLKNVIERWESNDFGGAECEQS